MKTTARKPRLWFSENNGKYRDAWKFCHGNINCSVSVPRAVAYEVFAGVGKLLGNVSTQFMIGIHTSLDIPGTASLGLALAFISYGAVNITSNGLDLFNEMFLLAGGKLSATIAPLLD